MENYKFIGKRAEKFLENYVDGSGISEAKKELNDVMEDLYFRVLDVYNLKINKEVPNDAE